MGHGIIDMQVEGMTEVQTFFDRPRSMAERQEIASALEAGGGLVVDAAKRRIHSVSGDLAGSLTVSTTVGNHRVIATVHHGQGGAHDHLLEYGHDASGWYQGSIWQVLPHPYLYPAYEEQKQSAYKLVRDAVREAVKRL